MKLRRTNLLAISLLAVVATLTITSACKDDIVLPAPRGLAGEYHGLMIITEGFGSASPVTDSDHVVFTLRGIDSTYQHKFDPTQDSTDANDFCDIDLGIWTILNQKIVLTPTKVSPGQTCNPNIIPEGQGFGINKFSTDVGDTLIVRQQLSDLLTVLELVLDKQLADE
ncbi:MAG: hypothetical protein ACE5GA_06625 [Candidatus Zixiibacteriota bacterium]